MKAKTYAKGSLIIIKKKFGYCAFKPALFRYFEFVY